MPPGPYASTAHAYRRAGWAPLPLPARAKAPVPEGWTGRTLAWPSGADVEEWVATRGDGNVGLRMPPTVLGIDVDAYGAKAGGQTLAGLEADLGALPDTWRSTSRDDGTSGIRFYLVPGSRRWPGVLGPGIETVRMEHRYAVAWPSVHPEGMTYRWLTPGGAISLTIPLADTMPTLPEPWLARFGSEALSEMPSAGLAETEALAWVAAHGGGQECEIVRRALETASRDLGTGSRHEAALLGANRLVWLAGEGHPGAAGALYSLQLAFLAAVQGDRPRAVALGEWGRLLAGAVNLAAASHPSVGGDPCRFQDLVRSAPHAGPTAPPPGSSPGEPGSRSPMTISSALPSPSPQQSPQQSPQEPPRATETALAIPEAPSPAEPVVGPLEAAWRQALLDRFPRVDWHALWADESQEEWLHRPLVGRGRSVVIYSPPKVGKSLLALELVVSLVTATPWLGSTPPRPLRVLLLDFENSPRDDIRVRLRAMGVQPDELEGLVLLSFPVMGGLDTTRGAQELLAVVEMYAPDLVVVDTVSRVIQGEENSNDTWLQVYRLVGLPLKTLGVAVLRLDHTGKDETRGMRGGSAKYGDVDAVWRLSQTVPGTRYRLECTESRMAMPTKVLDLERRADPLAHVLGGSMSLSPFATKVGRAVAWADDEGLPDTASSGDVEKVSRANGGRWATDVYREAARQRRERKAASGAGGMSEMPDLERSGQVPSAGADLSLTYEPEPEGQNPRSELTWERPGQDRSGQVSTLTAYSGPSGAVRRGGARSDDRPSGWWATIAGTRKWVDTATGETYDRPPETEPE